MEQKAEADLQVPFEFSNDDLKIKAHFKPSCKVELEIEVSPALVKEARHQAIKAVGKAVSIAGFRKGKAPEALIEKNYHKQVDDEWQRAIAQAATPPSLKLVNIPILNNEDKFSYNIKRHSLSDGAYLILFFETEPTIPEVKPEDLTLKHVERPAVNEDKVNETIRQLQLFFASWKKLDRPVQENDFVLLDVDATDENPPRKLFADVRFEVTDRSMAKWMKDLILGHHRGEILEGTSIPDEDATQDDKEKLKPTPVRVIIRDIEEASYPELTDSFAQKLGCTSVDELSKNVEKLLSKKADDHVQEKLREEASEVLLTKYPFDVPMSLIDREVRYRMQQLFQDAEYLKYWNSMTGEAKKRIVSSIAQQSEKAVRMFYLCRKILNQAKISLSLKDIPKPSNSPLELLLGERTDAHPQENTEVHQAETFSRLLLEKAEDYIIAHAKIS